MLTSVFENERNFNYVEDTTLVLRISTIIHGLIVYHML